MKFNVVKYRVMPMIFSAMTIVGSTTSVYAELFEDTEDLKEPPKSSAPALINDETKPKINLPQPASNQSKPAPAEPKSSNKTKQKPSKLGVVKFWSKSLSGFRDKGSLALEEDVVVTQDDVRIEADKATILFEPGTTSNEVREVHAVGSVKFMRQDPETGQPIKAEGREAVFNNAKRNVTLKGDPVLYRGDDIVKGKVIYYDLTNGWVKADRVEGVVQPTTKKAGGK